MADYTYTVFVSSSVFVIDYEIQAEIGLKSGLTYRFDMSDSSNTGHQFRFSTVSDGTRAGGSQWTSGFSTTESPTYPAINPGSAGSYVELVSDGYGTLYYYCPNHDGMGGTAKGTTNNTYFETQNLGAKVPIAGDSEDVWASHLNAGIRKLDAMATQFPSEVGGKVEIAAGNQAVWAGPITVGTSGTLTISGTLVVI